MLRQLATFVSSNVIRRRSHHNHEIIMAATTNTCSRLTPTSMTTPQIAITSTSSSRWIIRPLSTTTSSMSSRTLNNNEEEALLSPPPTITIEMEDGRKFALLDSRKLPKLKPNIVKRRLDRCKMFVGKKQNIRHSPWRMNLICQMIAGLPVPEAFKQLQFCEKSRAPLVSLLLKKVVTRAKRTDNLLPCQLEIAECFTTKGTPLKRIYIMGRGRSGKMNREHCHIRMVLREIDYKLRIYQETTYGGKKKWLALQIQAEEERKKIEQRQKKQDELEELLAKQREIEEKEKEEK